MTKARLQAEAAEKQDPGDAVGDFREPPLHAVSPLPPSLSNHRPRSYSQSRGGDAWSQQESRADTWETGSVSTAASDFLGSESAYGASSSLMGDDAASPSPFVRHVSFPSSTPPIQHFSDAPPPADRLALSCGLSLPEPTSGYPMNRYRASTLSPRPGLSHVDEHGQFVVSHDAPTFPSFSGTSNRSYRSRVAFGGPASFAANMEPNRPRTSSAVSLPPISHTAEEFSIDSTSLHRLPPVIGSVREDAPSPSVTGLADVFRELPARFANVPSPPGFSANPSANRPRIQTASSIGMGMHDHNGLDSFGEARGRAATWSEPSMDTLFGPGLFGGAGSPSADICDDLNSILKFDDDDEEEDGKLVRGGCHLYPPPGLS